MPRIKQHQNKKSDVVKMQEYYSIKEDLESEQAHLLRERDNLNQGPYANHPTQSIMTEHHKLHHESSSPNRHFSSSNTNHQRSVVDTLRSKIEEVIELCYGEENSDDYNELLEVIEAEKEVLNFLNGLTTGRETVREVNNKNREVISKKKESNKKSKVNKTYHHENTSREEYKKYNLSEDAMELIEEIERKALFEIESLRRDKINLMKKLNEEMRYLNDERRSRGVHNQNNSQWSHVDNKKVNNIKHHMEIVDEEENSEKYDHDNQEHLRPKSHSLYDPTNNSKLKGKRLKTQSYSNQRQGIHNNELNRGVSAGTEEEMNSNVDRIREENEKIRRSIAQVHDNNQIKADLRSELAQLSAKINQYENLIRNSRRQDVKINEREYQELVTQGNYITEEGNRLLHRVSSSKSFIYLDPNRSSLGSHTYEEANFKQQTNNENVARGGRATEDYSRPFLQTFSPMDRSFHSQTYKKAFSPTQYEIMIEEMRNATNE